MADEIPEIPPDMRKIHQRFNRWWSSPARRGPLPDSLRAAARELARKHGINLTAKALHLEYGKLKQRGVKAPFAAVPCAPSVAPPSFVELMPPRPGSGASAVVEFGGPRGRMKIELKSVATAELVALSWTLRNDRA